MKKYQCPNCDSYKTLANNQATALASVGMIVVGVFLGFLVLPLFFIPIGLFLLLVGAATKPTYVSCRGCGYKWNL